LVLLARSIVLFDCALITKAELGGATNISNSQTKAENNSIDNIFFVGDDEVLNTLAIKCYTLSVHSEGQIHGKDHF
jgi:hypothetical protein